MINKIILGTVQLGKNYGINNLSGKPSLSESFEILNSAYELGVRELDTAEDYGDSHKIIGQFHKEFPNRLFNIYTKHSFNNKKDIISSVRKNCEELGIPKLYGYMFHDIRSINRNRYLEILEAKNSGLINYIGISVYTNEEINLVSSNYNDLDFIQIPFNLLDNSSLRGFCIENARKNGLKIFARSVFLQGLFFKSKQKLNEFSNKLTPYFDEIDSIKGCYDLTIEQLALNYVIQKKYIDKVLIGVESRSQLINNFKYIFNSGNIPHEEIDNIKVKDYNLLNPLFWKKN